MLLKIGVIIFLMQFKNEAYSTTKTSFFLFIGKKISTEKNCAMHYHYDLHGNVKTLIQDNPALTVIPSGSEGSSAQSQRYKRLDYEYDLISGKVNTVHYQNSQPDQFHHKYEYDADNRLTNVWTSKDKIIWDQDAKYFYYPYGPLARVELGDNQVQGIDYAYTLQGWLKGVNSETLNEDRDIGKDGSPLTGNPNAHFAKDAFGYSLTYFEGDYQSIGTSSFEANKTNSDLLKSRNDLFNGNISAMVTTLVPPTLNGSTINYSPLPQGTAYKYDQLNRLVEMQAWQNIDAVNNRWGSGLTYSGMYNNTFTYDANGNIVTQLRKDQSGAAINDLTYNRMKDANGKLKQNRLYWVNDAVDKDVFADDIDDQQSGNYAYDEIGNLKQNTQKEIAEIKYSIYGKVKEVIRTSGSNKKNLKFDYDATGNRIAKHVYSSAGAWEKSEIYARDAQGNVMSIYKNENDATTQTASFAQIEKPIYGSSRIGTEKTKVELIGTSPIDTTQSVRVLGNKEFEGSNHLGNILTTFTDRKIPIDSDNDGTIDEYWPHVISSTDYYPFGVAMKERSFSDTMSRYHFNGKEFDRETETSDFGARMLDEDLGGFLSMDPLSKLYSFHTPYQFANNSPIENLDMEGKFSLSNHNKLTLDAAATLKNLNYFKVMSLVAGNISTDITTIGGLLQAGGENWHFDNLPDYYSILKQWEKVYKNINSRFPFDYFGLGADLHSIQDFYAHSNYVELYVLWFREKYGDDPLNVPIFDDGMKNKEFKEVLKEKLVTANFPSEYSENGEPKEFSHEALNKDNAIGFYGSLAYNVAKRHSTKIIEKFEDKENKQKEKDEDQSDNDYTMKLE